MSSRSIFQVYNASAGSGKTFTLVKEYLKILLLSDNIFHFQNILAITFTNKAAAEMKERVLVNLEQISKNESSDILQEILKETALDSETIISKSEKILNAILQNYSAFSITTIDSFTHKIIKNFAFDLGLSLNFEVEMDATSLLNEAVDVLLSKIGSDKKLTKVLIDFSLSKVDDDKSWDISKELNEFAKILLSENDAPHFNKLSERSIDDFITLDKKLKSKNKDIENKFEIIGQKGLEIIENNNLDFTDFSHKDLPNHFKKLIDFKSLKPKSLNFEGRLQKSFDANKNLYTAKIPAVKKQIIDSISEELINIYNESKELFKIEYSNYLIHKLVIKNIIPLAVLNYVNSELSSIKEENNIQLNAEFNRLISKEIKNEPTPFIYERIGQKFQHYFIDEMQDTSVLQWQNLIPLISNALSQEQTNLLLVGDGKQAIYRWRGGEATQFINLGNENEKSYNPFLVEKQIMQLETNYRSYSEVIKFNNSFFKHVSNFIQNPNYKQLFIEGNNQEENPKKGGLVSLNFIDKNEESKFDFPDKVLKIVNQLKTNFALGEICILVRKNKDGVAVANYLSENGIEIVSSETLLLSNSKKVNFIINILQLIQNPFDDEIRFEVLSFLYKHFKIEEDQHTFLAHFAHLENEELFFKFKDYGIYFDISKFYQLPLYEKIEELIRKFNLIENSDAYVQFFLDVVLEQQRKRISISEFLDFWELKKDKLSIIAPENENAVRIMSIHKSKGLEFPVVIFPYDLNIYYAGNEKVWLKDLSKENFEKFDEFLVNYSSQLELINKPSKEIYQQVQEELELDNFNLLYVALTRAVEQLHIVLPKEKESSKLYSGIFINYLKEIDQWKEDLDLYEFGFSERISQNPKNKSDVNSQKEYISHDWQEHNITMLASSSRLWDTKQEKAIDFGNLIHDMLSKIYLSTDVGKVIELYEKKGLLNTVDKTVIEKQINQIVNHPELNKYFGDENIIFNEKQILAKDGQIYIPDRLIFNTDKNVSIIDYKTGNQNQKHRQQITEYGSILSEMNFTVDKKLLIYIYDKILIEEVY